MCERCLTKEETRRRHLMDEILLASTQIALGCTDYATEERALGLWHALGASNDAVAALRQALGRPPHDPLCA